MPDRLYVFKTKANSSVRYKLYGAVGLAYMITNQKTGREGEVRVFHGSA